MPNLNFPSHYNHYITKIVKWLIIINILIFVFTIVFSHPGWFHIFGLVPISVIHHFTFWQLATYMFLHGGVMHLLINMLMLWFFGCNLERHWGSSKFLRYYFLTGIGAGIFSLLTSFNSPIPVIGASGAIFGILVAYAILFPETIVLIFFIFPMKIKHAVYIFGAVNLIGALTNPGGGVAYLAHIGGGLTGYLYFKRQKFLSPILKFYYTSKQKNKNKKEIKNQQMDIEIDEILEKISKYGMDSLTSKERKILKQKSKSL
jgi:membrane associated rhomboid family serine protease